MVDSSFTTTDIGALATFFGISVSDMREDLQLDSSNQPTDTSDTAKRNRSKAKGILILQQQIAAMGGE